MKKKDNSKDNGVEESKTAAKSTEQQPAIPAVTSAKTSNEKQQSVENQLLSSTDNCEGTCECSPFSCCKSSCKAFMLAFCVSCIACYLAADKIVSSYVAHQQNKLQSHLDNITELVARQATHLKQLEDQVADLQQKLATIHAMQDGSQCSRRDKWMAWVALRHKLENNENCTHELERFNRIFTNDKVLLEMVQELVRGIDCVSTNQGENEQSLCNRFLKQVVRFRKINQRKLSEVSGYVLSNTD